MGHAASPMVFDSTIIHTATHAVPKPTARCCQQAVVEALETAGSMGVIAVITILVMGFAAGLTTAWMVFG
ncbi:MAG: hypothetical protein ACOYXR_13000 [Nitrospirota bacterium]